jgi:hypothetical protein
MQVEGIALTENRSNTPLCQGGIAIHDLLFGYQGHRPEFGNLQRKLQTGNTAADDQKIGFNVLKILWVVHSEIVAGVQDAWGADLGEKLRAAPKGNFNQQCYGGHNSEERRR